MRALLGRLDGALLAGGPNTRPVQHGNMYLLEAKKKAEREAAIEDRKRAQQRQRELMQAGKTADAQRAMERAVSVHPPRSFGRPVGHARICQKHGFVLGRLGWSKGPRASLFV